MSNRQSLRQHLSPSYTMLAALTVEYHALDVWSEIRMELPGPLVLLVLSGKVTIRHCFVDPGTVMEWHRLGGRSNPFVGAGWALVLGHGGICVRTDGSMADVLVASLPKSDVSSNVRLLLRPEDFERKEISYGPGTARVVRVPRLPADFPLRFGETIQEAGNWSSWPEHEAEKKLLVAHPDEPRFDEVFWTLFDPADGWGALQRRGTWPKGSMVNDVVLLQSGDLTPVPCGFHPFVPGPMTRGMYAWFYYSAHGPGKVYGKHLGEMPYVG